MVCHQTKARRAARVHLLSPVSLSPVKLDDIAQFLNHFFAVHRFGNDQNGMYLPSTRSIARFAFDERLTLGFNPRLAAVLGMSTLEVLGEKEGRAIRGDREYSHPKFRQLLLLYRGSVRWT